MKIPVLKGIIKRRILINFRIDADVMQKQLPMCFRPKLYKGHAIAGICLIRLEDIRPSGWPAVIGFSSENAAHRVAVEWEDTTGKSHEGVYISRRDTSSCLNHLTGGRIFSGEHHLARFWVEDDGTKVDFAMKSHDREVLVQISGFDSDSLPTSSCFASLAEPSRFFEEGSLRYSATSNPRRLDALRLKTRDWQVGALTVEKIESSFFSNRALFPAGSVEFDHALIMRNIAHEWHQSADMSVERAEVSG